MSRTLPVLAGLAVGVLLSACTGSEVLAPTSAPSPGAKPALATPPSSMITPHGY